MIYNIYARLNDWIFFRQTQNVTEKLRTIQKVFDILRQSADELNSFNSAMFFAVFTTKTINLISLSYFLVNYTILEFNLKNFINYAMAIWQEIFHISLIINAADSPVDEVHSNYYSVIDDTSSILTN